MRKFLLLTFCLLSTACAGHRTLDGETTKNWVKIVSSRLDKSGNVQDVCFIFDLSFYPGTVYERLKNNPNTCLEECCWYSENKSVDFYFNDGFTKDLEEQGVSRRYYPDNIRINLNYSPFLNRLSARATSSEGISKDGVVTLEYEDVYKPEVMHNENLYNIKSKNYSDKTASDKLKEQQTADYKTLSMSGLNRAELLPKAQKERDEYYIVATEKRYVSPEKEYVEESLFFKNQVSPFDYPEDKEGKWLSKKTLTEEEELRLARYKQNRYTDEEKALAMAKLEAKKKADAEKAKAKGKQSAEKLKAANKDSYKEDGMYDMQRPYYEQSKLVHVDPIMPEKVDNDTLTLKLKYERKEAVKLLKRFYEDEIDAYLRALDKEKREEGQILLTNNKIWQAAKIGTTIYKVECNVEGKIILLGAKSDTEMEDYPISCGTYIVNLDEKTVEAKDDRAKKIVKKKY